MADLPSNDDMFHLSQIQTIAVATQMRRKKRASSSSLYWQNPTSIGITDVFTCTHTCTGSLSYVNVHLSTYNVSTQ